MKTTREQKIVRPGVYDDDDAMCYRSELDAAVAAEREACARVCEGLPLEWEDQPSIAQAELATMMDCALAIRARNKTQSKKTWNELTDEYLEKLAETHHKNCYFDTLTYARAIIAKLKELND